MIEDFKFIHIPRTGGETIEILLKVKKRHDLARHRGPLHGFVFSFVRNPYTRLYSWYSHLRRSLYMSPSELESFIESKRLNEILGGRGLAPNTRNFGPPSGIHLTLAMSHDFNDWVKIMMSDKFKYTEADHPAVHGPLLTCYEFLCDKKKKLIVDDIYYFENYNEELAKLFTKIDRKDLISKIEVTNQSKKPVPGEISEETKEMIYDHFEIDFTTFGYEK